MAYDKYILFIYLFILFIHLQIYLLFSDKLRRGRTTDT